MDELIRRYGFQHRAAFGIMTMHRHPDTAAARLVRMLYDRSGNKISRVKLFNNFEYMLITTCCQVTFAEAVFEQLARAMKQERTMGALLTGSYDKVCAVVSEIDGFRKDNIILRAVIALGILVVLFPKLVEKLGFVKWYIVEGVSFQPLYIHHDADLIRLFS
jgi:hypothetical protein